MMNPRWKRTSVCLKLPVLLTDTSTPPSLGFLSFIILFFKEPEPSLPPATGRAPHAPRVDSITRSGFPSDVINPFPPPWSEGALERVGARPRADWCGRVVIRLLRWRLSLSRAADTSLTGGRSGRILKTRSPSNKELDLRVWSWKGL